MDLLLHCVRLLAASKDDGLSLNNWSAVLRFSRSARFALAAVENLPSMTRTHRISTTASSKEATCALFVDPSFSLRPIVTFRCERTDDGAFSTRSLLVLGKLGTSTEWLFNDGRDDKMRLWHEQPTATARPRAWRLRIETRSTIFDFEADATLLQLMALHAPEEDEDAMEDCAQPNGTLYDDAEEALLQGWRI
jgi:hypothetical protein